MSSNCVLKPTAEDMVGHFCLLSGGCGLALRCTQRIQFRVFGNSSREWSMAALRSESRATRCCASSLRAGGAVAGSFGGSRAWASRRCAVSLSGRVSHGAEGRRLAPSARAVSVWRASPIGPSASGARPWRLARDLVAYSPLHPVGVGWATCSGVRYNSVFSRTAGNSPVLNPSLPAAAG